MASPRADDDEVLEPALVDAITEVVVWSAGAAHRAEVLAAIITCVAEAVRWRLEPHGGPVEEGSICQVLHVAAEHRRRMQEADRRYGPARNPGTVTSL